jgi:predicted GNAT family N-acyltransferase
MRLVELHEVSAKQWRELIGGEPSPWGGGQAEGLSWREKQRTVGIRDQDERLLAVAGAVIARVEVLGTGSFEVLGVGGVFVTRTARGQGLVTRLLDGLLAQAMRDGVPERAMLFCRAQLVGMYAKRGFAQLAVPVWADQPGGRIEMPMCAMWRALRAGVTWPTGRVEVHGLPF